MIFEICQNFYIDIANKYVPIKLQKVHIFTQILSCGFLPPLSSQNRPKPAEIGAPQNREFMFTHGLPQKKQTKIVILNLLQTTCILTWRTNLTIYCQIWLFKSTHRKSWIRPNRLLWSPLVADYLLNFRIRIFNYRSHSKLLSWLRQGSSSKRGTSFGGYHRVGSIVRLCRLVQCR